MADSSWQEVRLGDVASDVTVGFVGTMASEYVSTGVPFLRSLNIEPFHVNKDDLKFISQEFHERLKKSALRPGDVVIVRTGKPGTAAVIPQWLADSNCSDLVVVRPGPNLDARFLAYFVNGASSHHIDSHTVGAVQQHFNVGSAKALPIPLPSLSEQRAIAGVLGALDDKIELNRRLNRSLEELAQAVFRSWFVDFDPVTAKASGRPPIGLDPATADLFPNQFQDSELGLIPKGWSVARLADHIDYREGPGLRNWQYTSDGMKFLNIRCIGDGDIDTHVGNYISLDEFHKKYEHFALATDDIVLSTSGTLGRSAIVRDDHLPVMLNTSIIRFRGKGEMGLAFVWNFLRSTYFLDEMLASATGSVQLNFGPMHLERIVFVRPSDRLLREFESRCQPIIRKTLKLRQQSKTLTAARDALLPPLLSGELRVPDAERFVSEVL